MGTDFTLTEEVLRRLVERIIKLEVQQETLKRRVEEPFIDAVPFGVEGGLEGSSLVLRNRLLRLEEEQKAVQKHVQELFANVMDIELQSRGEPCHLHEDSMDCEEKTKPKWKWKEVLNKSFAKSSSIGIKYLGFGRSVPVRLFWFAWLVSSLVLTGVCIRNSYDRHLATPTTATLHRLAPLAVIPFPAVTVCPHRAIVSSFLLEGLSDDLQEMDSLSAAMLLCPPLMQKFTNWSNYFNNTVSQAFEQIMPKCYEDIAKVSWPGRATENCTNSFQTVFVDERVCHTFNMLPSHDMFLDTVAPRPAVVDKTGLSGGPVWPPRVQHSMDRTVPLHLDSDGEGSELSLVLSKLPFSQTVCTDQFQSYEVAVHAPDELPTKATHHYLRLPPNHTLYAAVTPILQISAECTAKESRMFSHYSRTNCQLECRVQCSVHLCGCVPLHLPRTHNGTRWCGLSRQFCYNNLVPDLLGGKLSWEEVARQYRLFIHEALGQAITDHLYNFPGEEGLTGEFLRRLAPDCSCHCPPACSTLKYHLDAQVLPQTYGAPTNRSEVHVCYKQGLKEFEIIETRITFNWIDTLGQCGGILALLTGLSVLSLLEVVYLMFAEGSTTTRSHQPPPDCVQPRGEWNKTAQTDPLFVTDCSFLSL